ncbi:right-handed parallel beta-helix repeat-containing protein [Chryseobacterium sp. MMS23-Vi53]|uniref:right-handed parallel beta-helix repeat-containing protein n=1 Tax=Chryseobacterium sp. MMS23-Vi53 TaxID=3386644 RepID=UPI0039EBDD04
MGSVFGHTLDIRLFGINPDSTADQTELIQDAINQAATLRKQLYFPNGTYYIKADGDLGDYVDFLRDSGGLALQNNSDLFLENDAKFYVIPNKKGQYNLFRIYNKKNVKIKGGILIGDRYSSEKNGMTTGEWGYGIAVSGSENVYIQDVQSIDMWGDGINLQYAEPDTNTHLDCKNVQITNVHCYDNRRQGMSIESGIDVIVQNSLFEKTNGTGPGCGIDVESAAINSIVKNVIIQNCVFRDNFSSGVLIMSRVDGASVLNCKFENNKDLEGQLKLYNNIGNIKIFGNTLIGDGVEAGGAALINGSNIQFINNTIKNGLLKIATVENGSNNGIDITDNFFISDFNFDSPVYTDGEYEISINFRNNVVDYRNVTNISGAGINLPNIKNSNFTDNKFYNIVRIAIGGNNNTLKNNIIDKTSSTSIVVTGDHNIVSGNTIINPCYIYDVYAVFNLDGNFNSVFENTVEKTISTVSQNLVNLTSTSKGNSFFSNTYYPISVNIGSTDPSNYFKINDNLLAASIVGKAGDVKKDNTDYYLCVESSELDDSGNITQNAVFKQIV